MLITSFLLKIFKKNKILFKINLKLKKLFLKLNSFLNLFFFKFKFKKVLKLQFFNKILLKNCNFNTFLNLNLKKNKFKKEFNFKNNFFNFKFILNNILFFLKIFNKKDVINIYKGLKVTCYDISQTISGL